MEEVPPQDQVEIDPVDAVATEADAVVAVKDGALAVEDGCGGDLITTVLPASASIIKILTH